MTAPEGSRRELLRTLFSRRMLVTLLMGFASGLPLLLTIGLLQAWMKEEGVDLGVIGLFALVQLPYSLKFLWAPIIDRFTLPLLGRRRGWLLTFQLLLMAAIFGLGQTDPQGQPAGVALAALLLTFLSASQDIVVDAYRREDLADEELGLGSSFYIYGYRLGMLLASGGGLILADHMSYARVYAWMAVAMLPGIITTLLTPEPKTPAGKPQSLMEAVVQPFVEYFRRSGAILILLFILLYKIGDWMATSMTTPFYLDIGFTKTDIGAITKIYGTSMTLIGAFLGGVILLRLGIHRSLWIFGVLQMVSTAGFALLSEVVVPEASATYRPLLAAVISFENLSMGMGTAAFTAYMASQTNKRFTATQYALLSSLVGLTRTLGSAPTGFLIEAVDWTAFFLICTAVAVPGLLLLFRIAPWRSEEGAAAAAD